jgi:hypothetical protein
MRRDIIVDVATLVSSSSTFTLAVALGAPPIDNLMMTNFLYLQAQLLFAAWNSLIFSRYPSVRS